jgi:hypothetical protein
MWRIYAALLWSWRGKPEGGEGIKEQQMLITKNGSVSMWKLNRFLMNQ